MSLTCNYPKELKLGANPIEELAHAHSMRIYVLCRIQSAQKVMEDLAVELSKHSTNAGYEGRNVVYKFREIEMAYLNSARAKMREISSRVTPDMLKRTGDFPKELSEFDKIFNDKETGPGMEPLN